MAKHYGDRVNFVQQPGFEHMDVTGEDDIEIRIGRNASGVVIWVNNDVRCLLRICNVRGRITVNDERREVNRPKQQWPDF